MITEEEFIHKCEFTCPRCKAVIRPSEATKAYRELLRRAGQERADSIIAEEIKDMKKQHDRLHIIENMLKQEGVDGDELEKLEKDLTAAISLGKLEQRFGKAKIQFG